MATLSIIVNDAILAEVVQAVCNIRGYSSTLPDGSANPETARQFVIRMVKEDLKTTVVRNRVNSAVTNAQSQEVIL